MVFERDKIRVEGEKLMRRSTYLTAIILGSMALAGSASAQDEPTGIVAYRSAVMKSMGDHAGALKSILTDQTQLIDQAGFHADTIAETAEIIPSMFPEGSLIEPTAALPAIWENFAGFEEAANNLRTLAAELAETSRSGDVQATLAAFGKMGKEGCGGCHEDFREKQN